MDKLKIGQIITEPQEKDAIHMAIAPVIAGHRMAPGHHVGIDSDGRASLNVTTIGIVDPFLTAVVQPGERFWLFLYPGSIKSLRHEWEHPAFMAGESGGSTKSEKSNAEEWMRAWALMNIHHGDGYSEIDSEGKYQFALMMGSKEYVGPNESAADEVTQEWWDNWELITGMKRPDEPYFSCSC